MTVLLDEVNRGFQETSSRWAGALYNENKLHNSAKAEHMEVVGSLLEVPREGKSKDIKN